MGYDMYAVDGPTLAETAAVDEARKKFDAAVELRSSLFDRDSPEWAAAQEKVMEACDAMDAERKSYFRLNISGMGWCLDYMYQFGMAYPGNYEGDWPKYPAVPEDATADQENHIEEQYTAAARPFLSQHPGATPGIPSFKFGSNDGWIVTEEECRQAVKAWQDAGSPAPQYEGEPLRWWQGWIDFLDYSSTRGGFKVH